MYLSIWISSLLEITEVIKFLPVVSGYKLFRIVKASLITFRASVFKNQSVHHW